MNKAGGKGLLHHVLRDHVLLGAAASFSMFPSFGWAGCLVFWAATVLIDLDHYAKFFYYTRFRQWSPSDMFRYFEATHSQRERPDCLMIEPLHTVEIFLLLGCAAIFWGGLWVPALAGMVFHALVDVVHLLSHKILTKRCHSLIEYVWRARQMRRRGLDPEAIFRAAGKSFKA